MIEGLEMEMPSQTQMERALTERGVRDECPRCGNRGWGRIPKFVHLLTSDSDTKVDLIGAGTFVTIGTACNTCGFVSLHAVQALNFT